MCLLVPLEPDFFSYVCVLLIALKKRKAMETRLLNSFPAVSAVGSWDSLRRSRSLAAVLPVGFVPSLRRALQEPEWHSTAALSLPSACGTPERGQGLAGGRWRGAARPAAAASGALPRLAVNRGAHRCAWARRSRSSTAACKGLRHLLQGAGGVSAVRTVRRPRWRRRDPA